MQIGILTILKEILAVNQFNKLRFLLAYGKYVPPFVRSYHKAYLRYARAFSGDHDEQEGTVRLLLLNAFNHILVSTNLLLQSLFVPSGNLMRHFSESIAGAIFFSARELNYFADYRRDKSAYRFDRIVNDLEKRQVQDRLGLDKAGIQNALKIHRFYHGYSHATAFSLSVLINFSRKNRIFLGPTYDAKRRMAYQIELRRRISACLLLENVIELARNQLDKSK